MATREDMLFKKAVYRIWERERLGLSTVSDRNHIYWQGDHNYSHLDMETIRQLSWVEFIDDNNTHKGLMGAHPNQYRKYNRALSWEEIEAIEDITK